MQVLLLVSTRSRLLARVFEVAFKSGLRDGVRVLSKARVKIKAH